VVDAKRDFEEWLRKAEPRQLLFSSHYFEKDAQRNVGKGRVEEFLFGPQDRLIYVIETTSSKGHPRFKAYYRFSRKKILLIVLDRMPDGLIRIVTNVIMDTRLMRSAIENANRYARIAKRL